MNSIPALVYHRIRYGEDGEDPNGRPCHDCAVREGEPHQNGCDAEQCPVCGGQFISCDCFEGKTCFVDDNYIIVFVDPEIEYSEETEEE